jgi:hypothetical protein
MRRCFVSSPNKTSVLEAVAEQRRDGIGAVIASVATAVTRTILAHTEASRRGADPSNG